MLKKLLLISLFLGFLRAEGEHYEIIAELSKAFLKAKEVLTAINKTYKTCIETGHDRTQIRLQNDFLENLSQTEQQFDDYFEKDFKSVGVLKTLLKDIQSLEKSSNKLACIAPKNAKNFEILEGAITQIIGLEEQMNQFINGTK
ncbi:hypothetical protein [Helicobacter pylori]|uniref:Uncharacterized protein n=1 Tax=Helicobacter pylori HP260AFii TaxID=1159077 RepID=A0ABC9S764_HELPX|nr:hypothetical protein [Helicobacter pylori]EMH18402.1 hypothetical protein HMPREF1416_01054 [Helicobacter pylori GAM260ASi]EMH28392.1 hypothetical protein HMPREF1422_01249 [Helicobacter pylori GAM268Bii]EMH64351.1 hypothetical protein HMPREF1449_01693 [Helicobacter pylori HP260AFii]EMH65197.1 hypothetical protein HMPREF1448_00172 [Helicobacter pylori HP260AFi]EMH66617.1 hypothetical protein HMPREF1450_01001 [Helicobacter pylori HP260ASii]